MRVVIFSGYMPEAATYELAEQIASSWELVIIRVTPPYTLRMSAYACSK